MILSRIVGVGSPFGDDQLGWRVAELLKNNIRLQKYMGQYLEIEISDRPGFQLVAAMKNIARFYVIDAIKTGHNPLGQLYRMNGQSIEGVPGFISTHGFGIVQALSLAKALGQLPMEMIIYGIEIGELEYQPVLSPLIESACHKLARQIAQELLAHA